MRYLAESDFPVRVRATLLIAGAYSTNMSEMTPEFAAPSSLTRFEEQAGHISLYHSEDDPVVPFAELEYYRAALPHATTRALIDRGHFNQGTFVELVADIKNQGQLFKELLVRIITHL